MKTTLAPSTMIIEWKTNGIALNRRHELTVDLTNSLIPTTHGVTTYARFAPTIPVRISGDVYESVARRDEHRQALLDAVRASNLIAQVPTTDAGPVALGELRVSFGDSEDPFQRVFASPLRNLTPQMRTVWDAAQRFMAEAPHHRLGARDTEASAS